MTVISPSVSQQQKDLARIEVDRTEMARILDVDLFEKITHQLKALRYQYVTLDLQGFRSGSLNEILGAPRPRP